MPDYDIVADLPCHVGEGPLWHPDEAALYFTDIPNGKLYRHDPATGDTDTVYHDARPIGGYTLQQDGSLLLFRDKGNVVTFRDAQVLDTVIDHIPGLESTRFNDVIADPRGGVFCGTMSSDDVAGRWYYLAPDGTLSQRLDDQGTPNGMGFSPDRKTLYYQDSRKATLWAFDYDPQNGQTTNQRALRIASDHDDRGRGDGMTVDAEGNLWSARWGGACVLKCTRDGTPVQAYDVPSDAVTSCCFAGPDMTDLYITSAMGQNRPKSGEYAGSLFKMNLGIKGVEEFRSLVGGAAAS
ncbi:MAG: SMP-30/gluconolactonase/LRE family protein [Planctomycetota bacterium]